MSTSNGPTLVSMPSKPGRQALRLRMAESPGRGRLDGGWWPRSRHLEAELPHLVDHFPPRLGRILHAWVSVPDWDHAPRRIPVSGGHVKVGSFPGHGAHLIRLVTSEGTVLGVLVVPPGLTPGQGDEALLAAATAGNAHSASDLLHEVTDHSDVDPLDHWSDADQGGRP
jgi:hypothetical protein